ncbi:hypothetical protein VMCG_02960 [Cytospora schulzeri]|uniref:Uncharacterized protein n=1 Tax=Cytospora schulzeri TaxID=448051 RepID=A0A423WZH7_9PEZI|nr:hypothetical protein VMCG_02960 [Valsa malicola]
MDEAMDNTLNTVKNDMSDQDSSTTDKDSVIETWPPVIDAVCKATRDAHPSSPPFDPAQPTPFQTYWHGVFARLHTSVLSDPSIPEALTSPPSPRFVITLFGRPNTMGCPCCLPRVRPNIVLENPAGVTKGELVRALMGYLYGPGLPRVYYWYESPGVIGRGGLEDGEELELEAGPEDEDFEASREDEDFEEFEEVPEDESQRTGQLIYTADWMSQGTGPDGLKYAYGRTEYKIWLYCSPWEEFETKAAETDRTAKNAAENDDASDTNVTMARL